MNIRWPRVLNPTHLSQILNLQKNPSTALHIFNSVQSRYPDYRHNGSVYATMINILHNANRIPEMNQLLNQMKHDSCELKDKHAASIIKKYAAANLVPEAVNFFKRLPEFNCVNWTASYNSILQIMVDNEYKLESLYTVFVENTNGWEVRSRIKSLNLLMDALCRYRRSDLAMEVFEEMGLRGFYPDRESYGIVMRGLCGEGRLNEAIHLLYSMFWRISRKGSGGDIAVYRILLESLCDHGMVDEAVRVLGKVLRKGLRAGKGRCKVPDVEGVCGERAKGVIREALVKGAVPSVESYGAVILDLYAEGKIDEGDRVLDGMRERGYEALAEIYVEKVGAYCREGLVDEAVKVVEEEMVRWSCVPTTSVYNVVVEGLCGKGRSVEAVRILDKMVRQAGCAPNKETYGVIVDGLCRDGMLDEASQILERMVNKLHRPGDSTFDGVIGGFCAVGRRYEVVLWLEEMVSHGVVPEPALWGALVDLFCHNMVETGAQLESIVLQSPEDVYSCVLSLT